MRGTIKKRAKDSWTIWWDEPRRSDGKRRQRNKAVKGTKKDAEAELRKILGSLDSGAYVKPTNMKVRDLLRQWLTEYVESQVRPRTGDGYRLICEKHLMPKLGDITLTHLRAGTVTNYYAAVAPSGGSTS